MDIRFSRTSIEQDVLSNEQMIALRARLNEARNKQEPLRKYYARAMELCFINSNQVSDGTLIQAVEQFVGLLINNLFPPQSEWMKLVPRRRLILNWVLQAKSINDTIDVSYHDVEQSLKVVYDAVTEEFFDELRRSNFYSVLPQFLNYVAIGTGCLLVLPEYDASQQSVLRFIAISPLEVYVEVAADNTVTGVFREVSIKASEILNQWGNELSPDAIDFLSKTNKTGTEHVRMWSSCVRESVKVKEKDGIKIYNWKFRIFINEKQAYIKYFEYNPYIIFFWDPQPGSNLGIGKVLKALPEMEELIVKKALIRKFKESVLTHKYFVVSGAEENCAEKAEALVDPSVSLICVSNPANYIPIPSPQLPTQALYLETAECERKIKSELLNFTVPDDKVMQATQVLALTKEIQEKFSGQVGPLQASFINPLAYICFELLSKFGKLDEVLVEHPLVIGGVQMPHENVGQIMSRQSFDIDVQSLPWQAEKAAKASRIMQVLSILPGLGLDIASYAKVDDIADFIIQSGSSQEFFYTSSEREQIREAQEKVLTEERGSLLSQLG